jgi:hypothetical protein
MTGAAADRAGKPLAAADAFIRHLQPAPRLAPGYLAPSNTKPGPLPRTPHSNSSPSTEVGRLEIQAARSRIMLRRIAARFVSPDSQLGGRMTPEDNEIRCSVLFITLNTDWPFWDDDQVLDARRFAIDRDENK